MKRSGSVTASAVICILGSLLTLLLGIGAIATFITFRARPELPQGATTAVFDISVFLLGEAIFFCGLAVFGIVMLRWRAPAHTLALVFYGFSLLSTIFTLILPGSVGRMLELMLQMSSQQNLPQPLFSTSWVWISMLFGILAMSVPVWFLITRRRAFLDACEAPLRGLET
jgi:carbon starvation protein CstA